MSEQWRVRQALGRLGLNRSMLVRRLIRLGHPRLRELRAEAMTGRGPRARRAARVRGWLEDGVLRVPQGHAGGLAFDMHYLPISHAHLGSIAGGNLESAVQEAMVRHLARGAVFYDIGANLGFFSLLAAHLTGLGRGPGVRLRGGARQRRGDPGQRRAEPHPERGRDRQSGGGALGNAVACRWSTTRAGQSWPSTASTRSPSA